MKERFKNWFSFGNIFLNTHLIASTVNSAICKILCFHSRNSWIWIMFNEQRSHSWKVGKHNKCCTSEFIIELHEKCDFFSCNSHKLMPANIFHRNSSQINSFHPKTEFTSTVELTWSVLSSIQLILQLQISVSITAFN